MEFHRAEIGRIDKPLKPIIYTDEDTIASLLLKANIVLSNFMNKMEVVLLVKEKNQKFNIICNEYIN